MHIGRLCRIAYIADQSKEVFSMSNSTSSPFAALSFSEQQEQWRIFRAQHLDFQEVSPQQELTRQQPTPTRTPAYMQNNAPRHYNLDRVQAQLSAASRRAGAFQPVTSTQE